MSVRKRTPASTGAPVDIDGRCLHRWPLPLPSDEGDKEDRGRLLVIGGSREIAGAVVLAGTAALRAGAGKLVVATARSVARAVITAMPEARVIALDEIGDGGVRLDEAMLERTYDAILVGPGMQDDAATVELAARVLERASDTPVVLDALAMDVVMRSPRPPHGTMLLTPHAGELAHLSGMDKEAILQDPLAAAIRQARQWRATVALKGATTIVATPGGRSWRHVGGNIGLAVSGSGDVLAGIVAGLVARGASVEQGAAWGVALHARAGAALAGRYGAVGLLARELPGEVPRLMHELSESDA